MKRTFLKSMTTVAVAGLLTSSVAMADDSSTGLIGVGTSFYHFKTADSLGLENDYTVPTFDLRVGAKNQDWRFLLSYSFVKDEDLSGGTAENNLLTGQLDYIFSTTPVEGGALVQPFVGGSLAYHNYKFGSAIDEDGVSYGAQIGAILDFDKVSIDVTARYMDSSLDNVNEFYGVSLGLNYKLSNE